MFKFNVGDEVFYLNRKCTVLTAYKGFLVNTYTCKEDKTLGRVYYNIDENLLTLIEKKEDINMSNEEKELRKDIEILLNIYLSNREMNKKEIKRFSERYFDIIEKRNAKNTLKRRGK